MGFFDKFPYSNPYQLNLDWIIAQMRKFEADYNQLDPDSFLRKSGGLVDGLLQMAENGSIDMSGKPLTGLKTAVNSGDALPFGQAEGRYLRKTGGKMSGILDMDGHNITGLETPVSNSDAATKQYVDLKIGTPEEPGAYLPLAGGMMSGDLNMDGHSLTGIQNPINSLDAVNKAYVDGLEAVTSAYIDGINVAIRQWSLGQFAPSGYGLGETNGKVCTDANAATEIGFYIMSGPGALNVPAGYEYAQLTVTRRNFDIYQTLIQNGIILFRQSADGGENWEEWSFVNPPMILGVEYRTTERSNGAVVYAKRFTTGAVTNGTNFVFTSDSVEVTECYAFASDHLLPYYAGGELLGGTWSMWFDISGHTFIPRLGTGYSTNVFDVTVKYIKKA